MKTCSKCKTDKSFKAFNKNVARADGLQTFCRDCDTTRKRNYYKDNVSKFLGYNSKRRTKLRERLISIKSQLSCPCGETHIACLEFHHPDPSVKEGSVSRLMSSRSWTKIKTEMEKCVVLCSNCHRKLHFNQL